MFCAKCGAVLDDNAKKCDQCGAPVRIRPNQTGRKNKNGKEPGPRSVEPALPADNEEEKFLTEEDAFMDPVFFKEAGKEVDVDAIIKIARGEDPQENSVKEDRKAVADRDYVSGEPVFDEPVSGAQEQEQEEPELDMDTYLAGLPLIEKIRRKIQAHHHRREEATDERRMKTHLERASKHFSEQEGVAAARPREEKRADKTAKTEQGAPQARPQKETGRPVKAEAESTGAAPIREEKPAAEKAEAERAEALRLQEEEARRREEEIRIGRIAAAARQKERARAGASKRQNAPQQEEESAPQQREGLEVIRLHGRNTEQQAALREEESAAEAVLQQEAEAAAEAARLQEEEKASEQKDRTEAQSAHAELQQEEKARIRRILNTSPQDYDSYRQLDSQQRRKLTAEERKLEEVRRLRKVRSNQQDRFDEYLGKYGLTKETAVRIATLFLIVLLSVIYVLGRGGSNAAPDLSDAGAGMTGIESAAGQTGGEAETEPAGEAGEIQVPTGGGDFGNN